MILKIKITKEILAKSANCMITEVSKNCALALALNELFENCSVNPLWVYVSKNGALEKFDLPKEATKFINKFDVATPEERINMDEFEFEINIAGASKALRSQIKENYKKSSSLELVDI